MLERWGYAAALSLDPYGFIVSRTGSRYSCQLHMLSRSEKLRFANAFSVALAIVSGWGFAVLDDSETIVGDDRKRFNTLVYDSELEQCLILAAEVMEKVPVIPGTAFIALDETIEDGISTSNARVIASTPRG